MRRWRGCPGDRHPCRWSAGHLTSNVVPCTFILHSALAPQPGAIGSSCGLRVMLPEQSGPFAYLTKNCVQTITQGVHQPYPDHNQHARSTIMALSSAEVRPRQAMTPSMGDNPA